MDTDERKGKLKFQVQQTKVQGPGSKFENEIAKVFSARRLVGQRCPSAPGRASGLKTRVGLHRSCCDELVLGIWSFFGFWFLVFGDLVAALPLHVHPWLKFLRGE
jgi:hypothetical protein